MRALLLAFVLLAAAGPAWAHEPCGHSRHTAPAYRIPTCSARQSPFRLTRLRTITISRADSPPVAAASSARSGQIRQPIDQVSCRDYEVVK